MGCLFWELGVSACGSSQGARLGVLLPSCLPAESSLLLPACTQPQLPTQDSCEHEPQSSTPLN